MTKISQLSSIGDSLAIGDQFLIRDIDDTGSPNKSVTVSGITRALDTGTALAPAIAFAGDKNTGIYSPGADTLAFVEGGTEVIRITSAGNVGIGTSSPSAKAEIVSSGSESTLILRNASSAGSTYSELKFAPFTGTTAAAAAIRAEYYTNDASTLAFRTTATNAEPTTKLFIDNTGNVGIGTSAPDYQLHVTTTFAVGASGFNQQLTFSNDTIQSLLLGTGYTALKLNPLGGNVGIGATPDPSFQLTINGNSAGVSPGILFTDSAASPRNFAFYINGSKNLVIRDSTASSDRLTIDSSGRLLVGTSTARVFNAGIGSATPRVQVEGTGDESILSITRNSADVGTPRLVLGKSRGSSIGGTTAVQADDFLGQISFEGTNGSSFLQAARIDCIVDGAVSGGGANDMPGRLVFSTTADGAASPTEAMRIKSTGIINFSNAPTYADNTAATAAGLAVGDVYKTVLGVLMIRF